MDTGGCVVGRILPVAEQLTEAAERVLFKVQLTGGAEDLRALHPGHLDTRQPVLVHLKGQAGRFGAILWSGFVSHLLQQWEGVLGDVGHQGGRICCIATLS